MELREAATDALTGQGTTALPEEQFNYIRNSVKATVDAYDGTVTLYAWDEEDPVLQTYMKAFPGVIEPRSEMPDELVSHVRYPEDLFKLQRDILTRYHVSDPQDFYQNNDRWQVPDDPTQNTDEAQPPYYILAQRPGDDDATFQLTSALNAFRRENLSSFISASRTRTRTPTGTSRSSDCRGTRRSSGPRRCSSRSTPTTTSRGT